MPFHPTPLMPIPKESTQIKSKGKAQQLNLNFNPASNLTLPFTFDAAENGFPSGLHTVEIDNQSSIVLTVTADGRAIRTIGNYSQRFLLNLSDQGGWSRIEITGSGTAVSGDTIALTFFDEVVAPPFVDAPSTVIAAGAKTLGALTVNGDLNANGPLEIIYNGDNMSIPGIFVHTTENGGETLLSVGRFGALGGTEFDDGIGQFMITSAGVVGIGRTLATPPYPGTVNYTYCTDPYFRAAGTVSSQATERPNITAVSRAYTTVGTEDLITVDATAGPITIALESAASFPGHQLTIKKIDATTNQVTVTAAASQGIENLGQSLVLTSTYDTVQLRSNGTSTWYVDTDARQPRSCSVFTTVAQSLTSGTDTSITFTGASVAYDQAGFFDATSGSFSAINPGLYHIAAHARVSAAAATSTTRLHVVGPSGGDLWSTQISNNAADGIRLNCVFTYSLNAGETITPMILQDSGATIDLVSSTFELTYLGRAP